MVHMTGCAGYFWGVQGYGACLTKANLDDLKRFVDDFAVRALLPAMEARVRALNHQVWSHDMQPASDLPLER